jgi:hypothetical protein
MFGLHAGWWIVDLRERYAQTAFNSWTTFIHISTANSQGLSSFTTTKRGYMSASYFTGCPPVKQNTNLCEKNVVKSHYSVREHDSYCKSFIGYKTCIDHDSRVPLPLQLNLPYYIAQSRISAANFEKYFSTSDAVFFLKHWYLVFECYISVIANNTNCLNKCYVSIPPYL